MSSRMVRSAAAVSRAATSAVSSTATIPHVTHSRSATRAGSRRELGDWKTRSEPGSADIYVTLNVVVAKSVPAVVVAVACTSTVPFAERVLKEYVPRPLELRRTLWVE
jgi:hypothetical protein